MRALGIDQRLDTNGSRGGRGDDRTATRLSIGSRKTRRCVTAQYASGCSDDAALDDVLQLPDIARPVIPRQSHHDVLGNRLDGFALLPGKRFDEVFHEKGNIVEPFAQRRQRDGKDVQPVKEIGPELPFLDQTSQVLVSRGDDTHINLDRMTTARPLELPLLKSAQKLRLKFERELSD